MIAFVVALRQTFRRALSIGGPVRRTSSARGAAKALRCLAFVAAVVSAPSFAANYPMELVLPRAVGTAPASGNDAVTARNRIFKAYPGIEYNIRAVVVGGAYPYSYSLSNAPSGMTIDANTGEISWPSPSGTTATPTITVRDAEGTQRSSPWTISVTTSGFRFIDAVNGSSGGDGSAANPWRSITDLVNSSAAPGEIIYFRSGTYTAGTLPRVSVGSPWERVEFGERIPNIWIAYPGSTPTIDFGGASGVLWRVHSDNLYMDGFTTRNSRVIGFQTGGGRYNVFRRLKMQDHNLARVNLDGSNAAFIMTTSAYSDSNTGGNSTTWGEYLVIQDCEFTNAPVDMALKIYSQWKLLIEDNVFQRMNIGTELKADMPQFTYRANKHYEVPGNSIGGNMHSYTTHGEILFNLVNVPSGQSAIDLNQDGQAKRVDVYRNTFVGRVRVRNVDTADGPFSLYNNVIVNSDPGTHIYTENISDGSRITIRDNLVGTSSTGIVDATSSLTGTYTQYLGTRGYEVYVGVRPQPPANVRVE